MSQYPKYPAYQDSGEPWIGGVPQHWTVDKLGNCLKPFSDKGHPDEQLLSITRELGVIERDSENDEDNHNFIPDDLSGYKLLKKGQFGMNKMKAWQGSYGVSQFRGIVSPAYFTFNLSEEINPRFFHVAVRSKGYVPFFGRASDGVRIGQWDLSKSRMKEIPFLIPPIAEQTAIANFLDDKTAKIDRAIAQKERLIALLKERKQILIQNAVTKGLDPTVKMKDSGIEWIGEIPAHWEVRRAKYLFFESDKRSQNGEEELLSVSHLTGVTARSEKSVNMFLSEDYSGSKIVQSGDVVYNVMWAWMGALGVSETEGIVSPAYGVYRQRGDQFHNVYLEWLLQSVDFRAYYNRVSTGLHSSRLRFYPHMFMNMHIIFPSLDEQRKIVEAVQKDLNKMDGFVNAFSNQIQKLREYRATLIDSAVTGKIKVPGV
jgi:type I restriction enzyme S subunit